MFAVAYYTLVLLTILAPVGIYCYKTEKYYNESENNND